MSAQVGTDRPARRWMLLLLIIAVVFVAIRLAAGEEGLTVARAAAMVRDAGSWGIVLYVAAFVVGEIALVPGAILIVAAGVVYGALPGFLLAYGGSIVASSASFGLARHLGVRAPSVRLPRIVERGLEHLDRRPVATVAGLRIIFAAYPGLSLALAASSIRARDYLIGTVVGLVIPVTLLTGLAAHLSR